VRGTIAAWITPRSSNRRGGSLQRVLEWMVASKACHCVTGFCTAPVSRRKVPSLNVSQFRVKVGLSFVRQESGARGYARIIRIKTLMIGQCGGVSGCECGPVSKCRRHPWRLDFHSICSYLRMNYVGVGDAHAYQSFYPAASLSKSFYRQIQTTFRSSASLLTFLGMGFHRKFIWCIKDRWVI